MRHDERQTMLIDFEHLTSFQYQDPNFLDKILAEFNRFEPYLRKALSVFMVDHNFPIANNRLVQVGFYNLPQTNKIRELKTYSIGRLMSIHGTVTRTTEVKPELMTGTFRCLVCNTQNVGIEQQFKYTEPVACKGNNCGNKTNWEIVNKDSIFVDWQKLRVQELATDIPAGSMPRSIDVILRGDIVEMAKPGDRSIFTGTMIVVPDVVQLMKPGEKQTTTKFDSANMQR